MKRISAFLSLAALLLVGCTREQLQSGESGMTEVSFTASLSVPATRATVDGDGAGANVNRCIMEIYFGDVLYKRLVGEVADSKASFSNIPVVAGKQYNVLFWADCGADELADKYYDTEDGLKAVTVDAEAFVDALEAGENDNLDAFFASKECTIAQTNSTFDVTLTRPFAQINVITTDVGEDAAVYSNDLLPEAVSVSYKAANVINVADGSISGEVEYSYEAGIYGEWSTVSGNSQLTLSMDYLLASDTKGTVDVAFKTKDGGAEVMSHSLTNLPYQRNYRTNVKGALLTVGGTWNAEIAKTWETPDFNENFVSITAATIAAANANIAASSDADVIEVKFTTVPTDAGVPAAGGDGTDAKNAILTTPIQEGKTLNIQITGTTDVLYVGDYTDATNTENLSNDAKAAKVNIVIPSDASVSSLVLNAPSKSVFIDSPASSSTSGTLTNLTAATSTNTLIIAKGQTVGSLTIQKGGLEIHGTVNSVTVSKSDGDIVVVRDCENLSESVYDALRQYIATGYIGVKGLTTEDKWDIVPAPFRLGADQYFYTIAEAITAAGETASTITVMKDHSFNSAVNKFAETAIGQTITLDLNGKKIVSSCSLGSASHMIVNNGTLTICDSSTDGSGYWSHGADPAWIYDGSDNYAGSYVSNLISNYGTLYLESGKLENVSTGSASYVVDNFSDSKITVSGGEYAAANTAFRLFYGKSEMTVTGGTFVSGKGYNIVQFTGSSSASKLTIAGGEFTTGRTDYPFNVYAWSDSEGGSSSVSVTGGIFHQWVAFGSLVNQENISVSGGKFCGAMSYGTGIFLTGGLFENKPDEASVAPGYLILKNTDTDTKTTYPWKVDGPYEALIGSVPYSTLAKAVAAAGSGETTVTLINDIRISSSVVVKDKKIVLNTNGKAVDPTGCRALVVNGDGELTIDGGGSFIATNTTGDNNAIVTLNSGKLTVENAYFEGANACIGINGGNAVINNATMKALNGGGCIICQGGEVDIYGLYFTCGGDDPDGPGSCWARDGGIINIHGGKFEAAPLSNKTHEAEVEQANYCLFDFSKYAEWGYVRGYINVYGGSFKDFNPAEDNQNGHSLVAEGYQSVKDGDYWVVSKAAE